MHDWAALVRSRLGALPLDPARQSDVVDELAQHVAQHHGELVASGLSDEEALARALAPLDQHRTRLAREIAQEDRPRVSAPTPPPPDSRLLLDLWRDVKYSVRVLARSRSFSVAAVLTLAVGIGANTAIFSLVNALLLRPLPYADGERLVTIGERMADGSANNVGYQTFVDWKRRTHSFQEMAVIRLWSPTLVSGGEPERITGLRVSSNYFRMLGVAPALGRDFLDDEDTPARWRLVIISDRLWRRRFGADPSIVGRALSMDDQQFTVTGVLPSSYEPLISEHFYQRADVWALVGYDASLSYACRRCEHLKALGRLHPGVSLDAALGDIDSVQQQLVVEFPSAYVRNPMTLVPLRQELTGTVRPALAALMAAVLLVLLIACANVANLLLARLAERRRDLTLRSALGATRARLVRQMLVESGLLALAGAALGTVISAVTVPLLARMAPDATMHALSVHFDVRVLGFTAVTALAAALAFGLMPALRASRMDESAASLQSDVRRTSSAPTALTRRLLIAADVALAVVLLVAAGLMIRSVGRLLGVDPGFDPDRVLTMQISMNGRAYAKDAAVVTKIEAIVAQLHQLPGVESVALAGQVPLNGNWDRWTMRVEGRPPGPDDPSVERYSVTPEYFAAMRIPLLRGRLIQDRDRDGTENVIVLGERTARTLWPGTNPIGQHVKIGGEPTPWRTVVGVVGDVHHEALAAAPTMQMYTPQAQLTDSFLTVVIRADGNADILANEARRAIRSVVPDVPVYDVAPLVRLVAASVAPRRFVMLLLELFSLAALLMTSVGVYGVLAYSVSERTREIGIRSALGASRTEIIRLVMGSGLGVVACGVAAGTLGALGAARFLRGSLFGVSAADPVTFASVAGILFAVAALAQLVPTIHAMHVDPSIALRQD